MGVERRNKNFPFPLFSAIISHGTQSKKNEATGLLNNESLLQILETPNNPRHEVEQAFVLLFARTRDHQGAEQLVQLLERNYPAYIKNVRQIVNLEPHLPRPGNA